MFFSGRYEWPPSNYKHVYFNATLNTVKIWGLLILAVLIIYESVKYLCQLIRTRSLHYSMFVVFVSSIYPHYYGWWNMFNYYNEEFYHQWNHQMFFTITEMISTFMVLHLCNKKNPVEPWKLLLVFNLNFLHIIIACVDQFIGNVIYGEAKDFEAIRDLALMSPDILHVLVPIFEIQIMAARNRVYIWELFYKEELMFTFFVLVMLSILGVHI